MEILIFVFLVGWGAYEFFSRFLGHLEKRAAIKSAETLAFHGKSHLMLKEESDEESEGEKVPEELVEAYKEIQREFPDKT